MQALLVLVDKTTSGYSTYMLCELVTDKRFPVAESLFQDSLVQPYVHNCEVTILEGRHIHRFHVFFKHHSYLSLNLLLSDGDRVFCGDAVIMRVGARFQQAVVNMCSRDSAVVDYMIMQ
ncbi:hypothetical protein J3R83DRAFT_3994 [Lanmaoa asiatica]|nr:hypothetical protein J3R83DRAFT_3994 [Lanmaoa asiatica]